MALSLDILQQKSTYKLVDAFKWPSLGSNQGLADYERRTHRFHSLSFNHKVIDFIVVAEIVIYFWFQRIAQKGTSCCTYVVLKNQNYERKCKNCM